MQLPSQRGADAALRRTKMCVHLKLNAKERRSEVCPVTKGRGGLSGNATKRPNPYIAEHAADRIRTR